MAQFQVVNKKLTVSFFNPLSLWNSTMMKIPFGDSNYVTNLLSPDIYGIEHYNIQYFKEYIRVIFEDSEFSIMVGYKNVLEEYYGDYMQLPPVEEQVVRHDFRKYYWN